MQLHNINQWLAGDLTRAFSWMLIHSLWQGLAAAIVAGLIIFCTRRSAAGLRYNLLSAVFLLFIVTTVYTFFSKYNSYQATGSVVIGNNDQSTLPTTISVTTRQKTEPFYKTFIDEAGLYFDRHAPLVVLVWLLVFMVQCLKLFGGFYYIQKIRSTQLSEVPEEWKEKLDVLCTQVGITQAVQFFQSALVKMPVVLGYFKPVILVPVGMLNQLPADQVETILLHELAHIRRKDYLVNLLQSLAETVFFFNPSIRWILSIIREEREACCDDIVVASTNNKTTYLQALVNFNDQSINSGYAMALAGRQTSLLNRVKRMLTYENNKLNIMEKVILVSGLVVFTAFSMVDTKQITILSAPAVLTSQVVEQLVPKESPQNAVVLSTGKEITPTEEKQDVPVVVPVKVDTVPAKSSTSTHMSTRIINDGAKNEVFEIIMKDDETGKNYKAKKVNNKITELYVNDVRIPASEMGAYKDVIEDIEEALQRGEEARKRGEEARVRGEEARVRGEEARKRGEEARLRGEEARREGVEARKRGEEARKRGEEAMKRGEEARVRGEEARVRGEEARKRGEEARVRGEETRKQVNAVVDELIKEKVISSEDNLTFTLSNNSLIVNGTKQSAALYNKLKQKLVMKDADTINYSRNGNSVSTSISRD